MLVEETVKAEPILKWAGSKRRLLPELLARVPRSFGRYFEPFVGGGAFFFGLAPERAILGDLNGDLVKTYNAVAVDPSAVVRRLQRHARRHSPEHYYNVRDQWRRRTSWSVARAAGAFIYLNKTCFNGLWRVNRAGHFNCPMGRYDKPAICQPEVLRAAHVALQRAELRAGDFRTSIADAEPGDFIYLDPPYVPLSATANFTSYSTNGFGFDDHRALADAARRLVARGCHVMVSNSDTAFVRELYKGFRIDRVKCGRSINSDATKRGDVDELTIWGDPNLRRMHH